MQDFILAALPVLLLVLLVMKPRGMAANRALPLAALVLYLLRLGYFGADPNHTHAVVMEGFLTALTPILIVWGAVLLFKTMEHSGAMATVCGWINHITPNRIGQVVILSWSFSFLIEGISGFGTPAALAAPLLVGLGFPAVPVAIVCLVMNSIPVSFGAVGMPLWFGLGELNLGPLELRAVGFKAALIHSAASLLIPLLALKFIFTTAEIRRNLLFIALSIVASVAPFLLLARLNVEFPSIIGGFLGFAATLIFAKRGIGLEKTAKPEGKNNVSVSAVELVKSLFPLWGTVLVLLVTRLPAFGLNTWLTSTRPFLRISMGTLGDLHVSPSFVVELRNILQAGENWKHAVFYVPSFLPFLLVALVCVPLFRMSRQKVSATWNDAYGRVKGPLGAFIGALVFSKLMMAGGDRSSAAILGSALADTLGSSWQFAAVYLGALGAFFSGSNTVSNLTFGAIQDSIASTLRLDRTTILSLQSVGGAMGNMVCLHNIVAVCSILGLSRQEGTVLRKTVWPMILYGVIAGLVSLFF